MKNLLTTAAIALATLISVSAQAHSNPRVNSTRAYNDEGTHFQLCSTDYDCCKKNPHLCEPGDAGYSAVHSIDAKTSFCLAATPTDTRSDARTGKSIINEQRPERLAALRAMVLAGYATQDVCDEELEDLVNYVRGLQNATPAKK